MTLDNAGIIADAVAGLAEAGFLVMVTRKLSGPTSPIDTTARTEQTIWLTVVQTATARAFMAQGQEVVVAKTLLFPATGYVPVQGDKVTIPSTGTVYSIVRVQSVAPAGVNLLHKVDLAT